MTLAQEPPQLYFGDLCLTDYPFLWSFEGDFGAGQNVYEVLAEMVAGEIIGSDRTANREIKLIFWTDTTNLMDAADAGAQLELEADKPRNTLTVHPGNFGEPYAFDTFRAQVVHLRSEASEMAGMRGFEVTIPALPWARSLEPVLSDVMSAPPLPDAPVVTTVDDGSSTSGWAASHSGSVTTTGTAVRGSWQSPTPRDVDSYHLARNGTFTMTDTRYLRVEWSTESRADHEWSGRVLTVNGNRYPASRIVNQETLPGGRIVSWLLIGSGVTVTQVGVRAVLTRTTMTPSPGPVPVPPGRIEVHDISRSDQLVTTTGTGHQTSHTIAVEGTAPTETSIHFWDELHTDLGDVLVYTGPKNGMVSLDPFVTTPTSALSGTVSGRSKSLSSAVVYDVPATLFDPNRSTGYLVMARLNTAGSGRLDTTLQSIVGQYEGLPIPLGPQQVQSTPATTGLDIVCLGAFTVPPLRVDGPDAGLRVTLWLNGPTGTPIVDDVWLVDIESGQLTWIDKTDAAFGHLWIEPATVDRPLPRVKIGSGPNGVVGREAMPKAYHGHVLKPGEVYLKAVATEAAISKVQVEYFRRWHNHARTL